MVAVVSSREWMIAVVISDLLECVREVQVPMWTGRSLRNPPEAALGRVPPNGNVGLERPVSACKAAVHKSGVLRASRRRLRPGAAITS
jgi:hypothetical protein